MLVDRKNGSVNIRIGTGDTKKICKMFSCQSMCIGTECPFYGFTSDSTAPVKIYVYDDCLEQNKP
jgi:hypothetical protein